MELIKSKSSANPVIYILLNKNESVIAEKGSMVAISPGIEVLVEASGGVVKSITRSFFSDEGFFFTRFLSNVDGAYVVLAPRFPGDISELNVEGNEFIIQSGSLLAHSEYISTSVEIIGIKGALMKEGLTGIRVSGRGEVVISAYGSIETINMNNGEEIYLDTGHLLAWSRGLEISLHLAGGVINQAFSGEGLIAKFTCIEDTAKIYFQSRSEQNLFDWMTPKRDQNR